MAQMTHTSVLKSASGFEMPVFGLGTWQSDRESLEAALNAALEAGYRLIDTAFMYNNEEAVGKVLSKWFSSGRLKREDLFITTKLPSYGDNPKYVKEYLQKSLKMLQISYVDLYLIHSPMALVPEDVGTHISNVGKLQWDLNVDLEAVWKEMEKQVDSGLTKSIGISKFNISQIERVLKIARIPPVNHQTEIYLYNQCKDMQVFCASKGITLTSFATLGSLNSPTFIRGLAEKNPLKDPVVIQTAEAHGKTAAQVLLRHMLQLGIAIIPKSSNPERIRQNIEVFDFELTEAEMVKLNGLDKGEEGRIFIFESMKSHPEFPYGR